MSLSVYLTLEGEKAKKGSGIFIREGGQTKEITAEEGNERYPNREPLILASPVDDSDEEDSEVFWGNITHNNLNRMADEANLYDYLWRPDENGIIHARQLIEPLRAGLALLESDPDRFREFNPSNGWGDYEGLVEFVRKYLAACEEYPQATVYASR